MLAHERPIHTSKREQATITENISLWEGVLINEMANIHEKREQATITENISLWEGVLAQKGQYTQEERTSYNNREYFTLGGCAGT